MAEAEPPAAIAEAVPASRGRRGAMRLLVGFGLFVFTLLLVGALALFVLDTAPGRRILVDRIDQLRPASGLRIHIGRIEGSVYGRMTLRDLRLSDPQGIFLEAPAVVLDWQPAGWLGKRLTIDEVSSRFVRLHRLPRLRSTGRQRSILPDFDLRLGELRVERLWLGPAIGGTPRLARLVGRIEIRKRRALIDLGAGLVNGGDRVALKLDSEPDRGRFDLAAALAAPMDGVIARLAGLKRPLMLTIAGDGDWQRWRGRADGSYGATDLLDLSLMMRAGRFTVTGAMRPSELLAGKAQRLTAPRVLVDAAATLSDRRLDTALSLRSAAMTLRAAGLVDLGAGRFDGLKVDARLLRTAALFPNMGGGPVDLRATVDGRLGGPAVDYRATAGFVSFDTTGFRTVSVSGRADLDGKSKIIPVHLTAAEVTGVGDVAGGILRNLKVDGPLFLDYPDLTGPRLALVSDRLKGTIGLVLDVRSGRYTVSLLGSLARYLIPGIGVVDVETRLQVIPGPNGTAGITGTATALVRRLDNGFFASLTGGLPRIEARLRRGPDRLLVFDDLKLVAPDVTLTGRGIRRPDGTMRIEASGRQARYGPLRLILDGDISRPRVDIALPRPGLGAGLTNVAALLEPTAEGWRFATRGQSTLGPFTSNGQLITPSGAPLIIDIAALTMADLVAQGRLRSLPGGFAGQLDLNGAGVTGQLLFRPQNGVQRIDANLSAHRARFPGPPAMTINRGQLQLAALLDPSGLSIEGSASARGLRRGNASLGQFDGKASLRAGRGTVTATIGGRRGTEFTFDTRADITPGRVALSVNGRLDGRPLSLQRPALFTHDGTGWSLAPAAISYAGGVATLAGRMGESVMIDARLAGMPLTVLDLAWPDLSLGGIASGTARFDFPADGVANGRARLVVKGLTRSGLVQTSRPMDLGIAALLDGNRAALRAVMMTGEHTIGRGQALISPIASGPAPLIDRLTDAPLIGQLRLNGPADSLWRLIGVEAIDFSGPVAVSADARGTLNRPLIQGRVVANGTRLESPITGTVIENIRASGRFDGSRLVLDQFTGTTPRNDGRVTGTGSFDLAAANGFGMDLSIDAQRARLLGRDDVTAVVTGPLRIRSDGAGGLVSGTVELNSGSYRFGTAAATEVPQLAVRQINRPRADEEVEVIRPSTPWRLDVKARGRNRLMVTGLGLDSEWRADLALSGRADQPSILGTADLVRGTYEFAGRRFDLERGQIRFPGGYPPDPSLDITAEATVTGLTAGIRVTGTGQHPEITFTSVPALPEDEVLSRLLFGTSIANLSAPEALQLAAAVASLQDGGGTGFNPLNRVGKALGVDRLRIAPGDAATGQGAMLSAGKYIGRRVYVEVGSDTQGNSATQIEVELTRWLSVLSRVSTLGETSINVRASKDY